MKTILVLMFFTGISYAQAPTGSGQVSPPSSGFTYDGTTSTALGNVNVGIALLGAGTVGAPSFAFAVDPTTGFYQRTHSYFDFSIGGVRKGGFENGTLFVGQATNHPNVLLYVGEASGAVTDVTMLPGMTTGYGIFLNPVISLTTDATDVFGQRVNATLIDDGIARTLTNAYGIKIEALTKGSNTTVTNAYGLEIVNPTIGANNYALHPMGNVLLDNNKFIYQKNAAGAVKNLISFSSGNNVQVGDTGGGFTAYYSAQGHYFNTNNGSNDAFRWKIEGAGNLLAYADNVYDIGASAANRPRTAYIGTALNVAGSAGITKTCTTAITAMTVVGGIITSLTCP